MFNAFGVVMIDDKDNIKVNSTKPASALEYLKKLMAVNPPEVYAWDDAGNNRWMISGKGSSIMNPPTSWAVAKRDNPKVAEKIWHHADAERPEGPLRRPVAAVLRRVGVLEEQVGGQGSPAAHVAEGAVAQLVEASIGYDLPSFKSMYDLDTWKTVEPAGRHRLRLSAARRRADLDVRRIPPAPKLAPRCTIRRSIR